MVEDIASGTRDGVLIYHPDRLARRPRDFEDFIDVLTAARVPLQFVTGGADPMTGDGLLILRIMAAVAANESASKSRRLKRKYQEIADNGLPLAGGHRRPFGYEPDKMTVRESEAAIIRQLAERFLAGESWLSLTGWLQDQQIPTTTGNPWHSTTVRGMMLSGRIAGLREYHRKIHGPAAWPGIITPETRDQMIALAQQRASQGKRARNRYALSGLLRCTCGTRMNCHSRPDRRVYVCPGGPDFGGCGRRKIEAGPVEELITTAVVLRLNSPELHQAMTRQAGPANDAAAIHSHIDELRKRKEMLATMLGTGELDALEFRAAREPIDRDLRTAQAKLAQLAGADALNSIDPTNPHLAEQFAALSISRQHAIIAAVLDHAIIHPGKLGSTRVDPARVEPVWRL